MKSSSYSNRICYGSSIFVVKLLLLTIISHPARILVEAFTLVSQNTVTTTTTTQQPFGIRTIHNINNDNNNNNNNIRFMQHRAATTTQLSVASDVVVNGEIAKVKKSREVCSFCLTVGILFFYKNCITSISLYCIPSIFVQ